MIKDMTKEQRKEIARQALKELSKSNYRDYLEYVHRGSYKHFKHTLLISEYLQRIADGEQLNILIEMPPRHGKSMTVTESFPSFYLGKHPDKHIIATAYSDSLATKFGRLNRNKFSEYAPELFDVNLSRDKNSASNFETTEGGGMLSASIGGAVTGEGADLMIIDDPFKNREQAESLTLRDKVWGEWEATLSTRLQDNASLIVIQTRWHEDDLIGRMIERSPRDWVRLRIPAIAEEDDLVGREVGEALAPQLGYDEKWLADKKLEVGSKMFASLYQQRPSPESGNIFKREWFQYYNVLPSKLDRVIISWDMTFKDNKDSDYVVGQCWGAKGADRYLIDEVRGRYSFTETLKKVKQFKNKHPEAREIVIEDKANGTAIIDTIKSEVQGVIPFEPVGSKIARAESVGPQFEARNIYLPENAPWVGDYEEELVSFPNAPNDDRVDATSQALIRLRKAKGGRVSTRSAWGY